MGCRSRGSSDSRPAAAGSGAYSSNWAARQRQGGAEALLLPDLVELHADLGARRVEGGEASRPARMAFAEARRVGAAIERELGAAQRLG